MTNSIDRLNLAKQAVLDPTGLQTKDIEQVMNRLLDAKVDAADIYFQSNHFESWVLESGIIKEGSYSIEQGAGVRAVSGDKTGFAYSERIELPVLLQAADNVKAIVRQAQNAAVQIPAPLHWQHYYAVANPLTSLTDQEKVDLLRTVDKQTRLLDPRIEEVIISLMGVHESVLVANQNGSLMADIRPLVRMNVSVIISDNGRREQGSMGGGTRGDYGYFIAEETALNYGKEAVRQALVNLEAVDAPAGNMTVVLGSGWPGILLHEAIGHGLEGDFNRKGTSAFSGLVGQRVASDLCTIVDDGTLHGRRGSLSIDDEGTPSENTVLIENGILKGYMQDQLNARLMGVKSTGNGRRESYFRCCCRESRRRCESSCGRKNNCRR